MRNLLFVSLLLTLIIVGCGASKDYVAQQIAESESRTSAQINTVQDKTDTNATEIAKLRSLATELGTKADMAINKAKGFENYQIIWQGEVNYEFDSYLITSTAEQILNECGQKLEAHPGSLVEIAGYTDRTGSSKYNLLLGEQRANAAKKFLAERFGNFSVSDVHHIVWRR